MDTVFTGSDWHGAEVVKVGPITPHPDVTSTQLEMTTVLGGIPVVVRKGEFKEDELAVYVGIDSLVPAKGERFGFLDPRGRGNKIVKIKAKKIRGVYSEGLLTPGRILSDDYVLAWEADPGFPDRNLERLNGHRNDNTIIPSQNVAWDYGSNFEEGGNFTKTFGITKFLYASEMEPVEFIFTVTNDLASPTGGLLPSVIFVHTTKPIHQVGEGPGYETNPAWVWITKERILASIKAGVCSIAECRTDTTIPADFIVQTDPHTFVPVGSRIKIRLYPGEVQKQRQGVYAGVTEFCPFDAKVPKYDLDPLRNWGRVLQEGQHVVIREKIHGSNFRAMWANGRLWVGTHRRWIAPPTPGYKCSYWDVAVKYDLETKLKLIPNVVVYAEVFGNIQDLHYGAGPDDIFLAVFDILNCRNDGLLPWAKRQDNEEVLKPDFVDPFWLDNIDLSDVCREINLPMAPLLYEGPWHLELMNLRNGPSIFPGANHCREGFVVRPVHETMVQGLGRVVLKVVGEDYKLRS